MRANEEEGMIQEAKIITFAHEVQIRLFPVYTFKMMNLKSEHDSNEATETAEQLVSEISTRLLRLGKFLNDNSKVILSAFCVLFCVIFVELFCCCCCMIESVQEGFD